jgi:alpha/beta superfamily hydrolase
MKQTAITFRSGTFTLHGYCYTPDDEGKYPAVVLCHPHPLNGGSMSNIIIRNLGEALASRSIIALMFNFRGVGKSEGSYGGGIGEQEDLIAALDLVSARQDVDTERIGAAGYSFGSSVVVPVASRDARVKAIALISPALDSSYIPYLQQYKRPKFIISGTEDDLILLENVAVWGAEAAEPKQLEFVGGADHFWNGKDDEVVEKVAEYFKQLFKSGGG